VRLLALMCVMASLFHGCSYLNKKAGFKDDNVIEEAAEKQIEKYLGYDIDLTPFSSER